MVLSRGLAVKWCHVVVNKTLLIFGFR